MCLKMPIFVLTKKQLFTKMPRIGGRQKGTPNKVSKGTKEKLADFINDNFDEFVEAWKSLPSTNPYKLSTFVQVLKLVIPVPREDDGKEDERASAIRKSIEDINKLDKKKNG